MGKRKIDKKAEKALTTDTLNTNNNNLDNFFAIFAKQKDASYYEKHDQIYHICFSVREITIDLIIANLPDSIVKDLDFSRMRLLPNAFVTRKNEKRYSDLIWKIYWRDRPFYFCLLCEFQNYNDRLMPLRIAEYVLLLWRKLMESGEIKESDPLPLILPIVIYNGSQNWTAPLDINSLLDQTEHTTLLKYQVQQTYLLVNMSHDPALTEIDNNFTVFFAGLEQLLKDANTEDIFKVVDKRLKDILGDGEDAESKERYYIVFEALKSFLSYIISKHSKQQITITGDDIMSLESNFNREWKPMCERQFDLGFVEGKKQGEKAGFLQGKKQGEKQGFLKGEEQGFLKGEEQGEKRGITKEKLTTATNMLYEGFDFAIINKITGLDLTTIQDLAKKLKKQ